MLDSRFPISVSRNFCYRSTIEDLGEILDTDDFKTLYRVTRTHLKDAVSSAIEYDEYKTYCAKMEFGFEILYEVKSGYFYTEWVSLKTIGIMYVGKYYEAMYRTDGTDCVNYRNGVSSNPYSRVY